LLRENKVLKGHEVPFEVLLVEHERVRIAN
jgi:hypothetical protein